MKKFRLLFYSLISTIIICSCTTSFQAYSGSKQKDSELAILYAKSNYYIYSIDSQKLRKPFSGTVIKAKPGNHTLKMKVKKEKTFYGTNQKMIAEYNKTVYWNAKKGHKYKLVSKGSIGAPNISVKIIDITYKN